LDDCQGCGHKFGHHPAGPQGEGRSSCHLLIHHRCCALKLSLAHLTISFASFCNIAQAGGGQGELLCCVMCVVVVIIFPHAPFC
jgi:hypothetical protein